MRSLCLVVAAGLLPAAIASAEAPTIEHTAVKCIVAGRYPKLEAAFAPAPVARARSYFRPEGVPSWYYVEMTADASAPSAYAGVLPRPTKKLVGKTIDYYLEASSAAFDSGRTLEYAPLVVARPEECKEQPIAAYAAGPPAGVFPNLPEGFALAGSFPVAAVAIVGGGAAAATTVVALQGDDEPATTTTTQRPLDPTPTPTPPTTVTTLPGFEVACQAQPRQGVAPLRVLFNASAAGGTGVYDFLWTFGDGETSNQVSPGHTYARAGTYLASVVVTSGSASRGCEKDITVTPLVTDYDLTVSKSGTGTGRVSGLDIDCGSDCGDTYPEGTIVMLVAEAAAGSTFGGWGGDCSGTGGCTLTMDRAHTVTASFVEIPVLNVSRAGSGAPFAAVVGPGINCGTDCTETYPVGESVTLDPSPAPSAPPVAFDGWSGACSGTAGCNLVMNGARTVIATFTRLFSLSVAIPSNRGSVESDPPGIECPKDCFFQYRDGETVQLTAEANPDNFFIRWDGDCTGTVPTCSVVMTANRNVTAVFNSVPFRPDGTGAPPLGATLRWASRLDVDGAWGRVRGNGADVGAAAGGQATLAIPARAGANRVEADLQGGSGRAGSWRFELLDREALEPGSLRVLEGQVLLVTEDAIVFRLSGRGGERVAFTYRSRE